MAEEQRSHEHACDSLVALIRPETIKMILWRILISAIKALIKNFKIIYCLGIWYTGTELLYNEGGEAWALPDFFSFQL